MLDGQRCFLCHARVITLDFAKGVEGGLGGGVGTPSPHPVLCKTCWNIRFGKSQPNQKTVASKLERRSTKFSKVIDRLAKLFNKDI